MAWVRLRQFNWTTRPAGDGLPEVDYIEEAADPASLPVDISDLILTNALATTVSQRVLYDTTVQELRLIGSYLHQAQHEQLCLRSDPFGASALHIRRFVTESVGLGMLTASVQAAYRWYGRGHMHNFDALPASLAATYRGRGARPDLLFDTPEMMLAGEARGRSRTPPLAPTSDHHKRLNSLLPWAAYHGHNLVMTWTYLTADGVAVDWFAEDGGLPDLMDQVGVRMPQDRPYANLVAPPDYVEPPFGTTADRPPEQRMFDHTDRAEIVARAQRTVARIERRLFATAPTAVAPIRVAGRGTRGRWVPFDLFGASTGSFLLAVLDEPMSLRDGQDVARRIRNLIRDETDVSATAPGQLPPDLPMTVSVRGRLIAAVAGPGLIEPWNLLDVG